jgi:RNA polymerase sigma-70 factor (ECF subfamily)
VDQRRLRYPCGPVTSRSDSPLAAPSALREPTDADLVKRIADGRQEALGELYDRYAPLLLALARRILGSAADAEEVVQEALLQVWGQAGRYDPRRSSVTTWLVLLTRSRAIDLLRSRRVRERAVEAAGDEGGLRHASPEGPRAVWSAERAARIRAVLAGLPAEQREVLEQSFFRGWSQREIAERTGIPLGTVKTRTLLAMRKLRQLLRDEARELL